MLNTAQIVFSNHIQEQNIVDCLMELEITKHNGYWIFSIPPLRHVRFHIARIEQFELYEEELDFLSGTLGELSPKGIWLEMSTEEKQGRLAVQLCADVLRNLNNGLVIDENEKIYTLPELEKMQFANKGFYE